MNVRPRSRSASGWLTASLCLGLGSTAACASSHPTAARQDVADILQQRTTLTDSLPDPTDRDASAAVDATVDRLLREPLTLQSALRVALLNNRGLQATFEDLGIAQADLVSAGLLRNPVISGDLVFSTRGNGLGGGLSLAQSLLSAALIPAKKHVAKRHLQRTVLMVSDATLVLLRDVKIAYAEVQRAVAARDVYRTLAQTAEVADEFSARLLEAGNTTELDRGLFAADLDHARLALAEHELAVSLAREDLNRALGLWGPRIDWTLAQPLPEPPDAEVDLGQVEQLGVAQRLDLQAARMQVQALQYAVKLRRKGLIPDIEVGAVARNEIGNDVGHEWVLGPSLSIELPIFDPGLADVARLGALLRQAEHELQHQAIDARATIRGYRASLMTHRAQALYLRDTVLPRRQALGQRALERYNGMLIGTYELLDLRSDAAESELAYIDALHEYWVSRAQLEWAVGGQLPPS